jgi:hypothetical protein
VAGGINSANQILNSAKLVSSSKASVTTDKTDYAPGQIVTITGSGFQPNEQVDIYFHEFPEAYPDVFLSATANQQGNFVTAEFAPQEIDLGRIFILTAIGQSSGFTAQTAFKDNKNLTVTKAGSGSGTITSTPSGASGSANGNSINCNSSCSSQTLAFDNLDTVTLTAVPASGSVFLGWNVVGGASSLSPGCTSGATTCRFNMNNNAISVTATFNAAAATTTISISAPTITYNTNGSVTVDVSATVGTPTGNVTLAVDGGTPVSKLLSGGSAIFTSSDISALASPNAGDHSLSANYAAQGNFTASSATGNLHVNKASSTTTVTFEAGPYTYRGTAFTATAAVTGVGGLNQPVAVVYSGDCLNVTLANGCTATATFAGDTNHNGSNDTKSISINKRLVTVKATDISRVYGESTPAFSMFLSAGTMAPGDTLASLGTPGFITSPTNPAVSVGSYTIAVSGLSNANYYISYDNTGTLQITYAVCLLFDNNKAVQKNATIPIKLNLCDTNKVNVSSSAVVLMATNLVWWGAESAPDVQDSGNANPDDNFRFTGGSYMFNLSTKNLWSGKWGLEVKANGDPLSHIVIFNVK